jgi:hypothetical protein
MSKFHAVAASGPNATSIKAAPGVITSYEIFNRGQYAIFVKFHDTSAVPTPGAGVSRTIGVQAGESAEEVCFFEFQAGIGMTIVRGIQDADATPIALDDCVVDVTYT